MKHKSLWMAAAVILIVLSAAPASSVLFEDNFDSPGLDKSKWKITRQGDCSEEAVEVLDFYPEKSSDGSLLLRMATMNTDPAAVKFRGVRSKKAFPLEKVKILSWDFDWNNQSNGCYLTAGIFLSPEVSDNPKASENWLCVEYMGVPPGRRARCAISTCSNGRVKYLYTEGWPKERAGRTIGKISCSIIFGEKGFEYHENGTTLYSYEGRSHNFSQAYLYLQMSSHSNYPAREVFFDNIRISGPD